MIGSNHTVYDEAIYLHSNFLGELWNDELLAAYKTALALKAMLEADSVKFSVESIYDRD